MFCQYKVPYASGLDYISAPTAPHRPHRSVDSDSLPAAPSPASPPSRADLPRTLPADQFRACDWRLAVLFGATQEGGDIEDVITQHAVRVVQVCSLSLALEVDDAVTYGKYIVVTCNLATPTGTYKTDLNQLN